MTADPNDIYMQRVVEQTKHRTEKAAMHKRLRDELDKGTPRAMRAIRHARYVLAAVSKFVPDACRDDAYEELLLGFFWQDLEIVEVPPERDIEMKAEIEAHKFTLPKMIIPLTEQ